MTDPLRPATPPGQVPASPHPDIAVKLLEQQREIGELREQANTAYKRGRADERAAVVADLEAKAASFGDDYIGINRRHAYRCAARIAREGLTQTETGETHAE